MATSMTGYQGLAGPTGKVGSKIPSGYKQYQVSQFTPEQQQQFAGLFGHVGPESYLSKLAGGDEEMFRQIEAPAMRKFQELQGGLASRFSGMGTGARRGSGFQNTATSAASNFAESLQANRQALQRQALMDLFGLSEQLLNQRPYESGLVKKPQGTDWGGLVGKLFGAIPGVATAFASGGNPMSGVTGAVEGFSQAFGGPSFGGYGQQTSGRYGLPTFMGR